MEYDMQEKGIIIRHDGVETAQGFDYKELGYLPTGKVIISLAKGLSATKLNEAQNDYKITNKDITVVVDKKNTKGMYLSVK